MAATELTETILRIRHPAHEIELAAEVAYWDPRHRTYMLGNIVEQFDKLAELVAELRTALAPQEEAA